MQVSEDIQIRIKKRTHKKLVRIGGELTARDSVYTPLDLTISELIRFWDEFEGLKKSLESYQKE